MSASEEGLLASLRGGVATLLETLQVRLELLATELEEEKLRLLRLLGFGAAAFVLLAAGLLCLAFFLVILLWDEHRLLVLGLVALAFLGAGAIAAAIAWRALRGPSRLFAASVAELAQDREALRRKPPA